MGMRYRYRKGAIIPPRMESGNNATIHQPHVCISPGQWK